MARIRRSGRGGQSDGYLGWTYTCGVVRSIAKWRHAPFTHGNRRPSYCFAILVATEFSGPR